MTEILGIDLGTTNSAVAIWRDGKPQLIGDAEGNVLTPSVVAIDPSTGELVVGHQACQIALENPQTAIYSIKRFMGRRFKDDIVQDDLESNLILYCLQESSQRRGGIQVVVADKTLTPQEVSAKILQKLKADAEAFLGHEVTQAVITVPAYFHDSQRQATRDAGRLAGLEVMRVVNEPTAACLAFGYQKLKEIRQRVAVYDLGGGTFDISILEVGRGPFRVLATNGDTHLGGDDIDHLIVDWIISQINSEQKEQLENNPEIMANLYDLAEKAKISLSLTEEVSLKIQDIANLKALDLTLTQPQLNEMTQSLVDKTLTICRRALHDASLQSSDIQEVLLVGGQTRMPAIRQALQKFFNKEPNITLNPEEVVAQGAAVQAAILAGLVTGLKLADVVPLSLGVSSKGEMDTIIPRNTSVPVIKSKIYSTPNDNQESVQIQIYQGEYSSVADKRNVKLGEFILTGIEPARAGEPEIEVTFRVDQDSILHVSAKDLRTNNYKEITITDSVKLSEAEIAAMLADVDKSSEEKL